MNVVLIVLGVLVAIVFVAALATAAYNLLLGMAGYSTIHGTEDRKYWLTHALQVALQAVEPERIPEGLAPLGLDIQRDVAQRMNTLFRLYRVRLTVSAEEVGVIYAEFRRERYDSSLAGVLNRLAGGTSDPTGAMRPMRPNVNGPQQGNAPTDQQ